VVVVFPKAVLALAALELLVKAMLAALVARLDLAAAVELAALVGMQAQAVVVTVA
jgi:hypothetical protein